MHDVDLQVESSSPNHIDALINRGEENSRRFIGFYGALETQLRMESWNLIGNFHQGFFYCPGYVLVILMRLPKLMKN